jgi:nucleoside-triphosphatase THEP1
MKPGVYILSDAVQAGKTSALLEFVAKHSTSTSGFLTPDLNNLRHFIELETNTCYVFQQLQKGTDTIEIGNFIFDKKIFEKAQQILQNLTSSNASIIIIDEIGKLELEHLGLEPALTNFINQLNTITQKIIIFVVRDTILDNVIKKYSLQNAIVLNVQQFKAAFEI